MKRKREKRYLGETGTPLEILLDEHRKIVKLCKCNRSRLTKHVWEEHHKDLWHNTEIIVRKPSFLKRKIVVAFFSVKNSLNSEKMKYTSLI